MEQSDVRARIIERFEQGYREADRVILFGYWVKVCALGIAGLGVVIWLVTAIAGSIGSAINQSPFHIFTFVPLVLVIAFWTAVVYGFGVLICAHGRTLCASLDAALNTSPFLSNEDRELILFGSPDSQVEV